MNLGRARQQNMRYIAHLEEDLRDNEDELDDYWKCTISQRIAQDRQMWKQHAEAFTQP